jgi:hypothetical protein
MDKGKVYAKREVQQHNGRRVVVTRLVTDQPAAEQKKR